MGMNQDKHHTAGNSEPLPPAETGNASNPAPHNSDLEPDNNNQLLDGRAEKYLREVASPEDYPDEEDWQDAEKIMDGSEQTADDGKQDQ